MRGTEWLIVDTETDGLMDPIHVVEIAAQRMNGWEPVGERFRVLLNHNVPIPPAAVAVHGYTEEFLRRHGEKPHVAHAQFHDFAQGLPIVAHNLSFDWNRALEPEWRRLGLAPAAQRGFCSLMLSRRVVDGARSYSLDALREMFSISTNHAHRAFGDVDAVVELFTHVFRPKLEGAGIDSFDGVMEFACKTPVAKCLCQFRVQPANSGSGGKAEGLDSWYFIDGQNESRGPLRATEIVALTGGVACWVWQDGMADWVSSENHQAFLEALQKPNAKTPRGRARARRNPASKVEELKTICGDILKDGVVTTEEVVQLAQWLEQAGEINEWPATEIAQALESILMDGAVTDEERKELQVLLERANENGSPAGCDAGASPNETPLLPVTKVELTCVGNAGSGYPQTQIRVVWFEVLVNKERRWVDVIEHDLPIKSHRRENRINYCTYEIPEGVVCFFERYVQTKPRVHERKFFQMLDGEFKDLGEGVQFDFVARFLGEYEGWNVCVGQNREDLREMRGQSADEETRESMGLFETTATIRVNEARAEPAKPAELQSNPGQFSVVELTQGTQEWLQWRQEGIGASDAPTIMGENPWKTAADLMREKRGRAKRGGENAAMAMGTALEPEARKAYCMHRATLVEPACLQSEAHPWLRASVDGISSDWDRVVEIKCGESVYRKTAATGRAPGYYYGQLQHILAVTGLGEIDFWCYLPGLSPVLVTVERDERYITRMIKAEYEFWKAVRQG